MAIQTTGSMSKALMPGVRLWFGAEYERHPDEYTHIVDVKKSTRNFEEDVNLHGYGLGAVIPEGEDVTYQTRQQGFIKRYTNVVYGTGFQITREAMEDNQYESIAEANSRAIGMGMKQLKETIVANMLNRANNSSYVGADAVEFSSSLHLLSKGGTYSNELATSSELSEAGLEQALIDIGGFVDDASLKMAARGVKLILPRQLEFEAQRILKSTLKYDTAENAVNVLREGGYLPGGYHINHFLSSATKWFIKTSVPNGAQLLDRRAIEIRNETDFDSDMMKYKITERYCVGWTDPRGFFFNGA